jgi:hypothetical protein
LHWDDVPQSYVLSDGSTFDVDFQDGVTILPLVGSLTTQAYVTVTNVGGGSAAPGEAPLPAAAPLFGAGLGFLGLLGWRRKRQTSTRATT